MNGSMRIDKHMPVDRVAKRVWLPHHIDDDFNAEDLALRQSMGEWWKEPKVGIAVTSQYTNNPSFVDITGLKVFRSEVVNFLGGKEWQLKCSCGNYFKKSLKKIKEAKAANGICVECYQRYRLKRNHEFYTKGFNSMTIEEMIRAY